MLASIGIKITFNQNLVSQTICTTVVLVIGVLQTSLMVGGFQSKALLALREEELIPQLSAVVEVSCHVV